MPTLALNINQHLHSINKKNYIHWYQNKPCTLELLSFSYFIPYPHLLYLLVRVPRAPLARVLKCGVSPRVPGATESPSLGEVVLRPLTAPSRLLSPRLGDLRARQASATA